MPQSNSYNSSDVFFIIADTRSDGRSGHRCGGGRRGGIHLLLAMSHLTIDHVFPVETEQGGGGVLTCCLP